MSLDTTQPPASWKPLRSLAPGDWIVCGILLALFAPMFYEMFKLWTIPEAPQSYAMLILPAALALAWMLRERLVGVPINPSKWGLAVVGLGLLFLLVGTLATALTVSALGFVLTITGVVLARYGSAIAYKLWFPLAYLLTMVPVPTEILNLFTFPLQKISIHWAALILSPFNKVQVEGTQLHFGDYALNVIAPCSGLTIVLPLMVLAAFYLYIIAAPLWKKGILAVLIFPLAMVVNALRVALIAVVGEGLGQHAADTFHDYSGLITVILGFVALILIAKEIKCDQIADDITV